MSITKTTKVCYKLQCEWADCRHKWESNDIPKRCSSCKRISWNKSDHQSRPKAKPITANGKTQTIAEWAKEIGISVPTLRYRLKSGWPMKDCLVPERSTHRQATEDKRVNITKIEIHLPDPLPPATPSVVEVFQTMTLEEARKKWANTKPGEKR